MDKNRKYLDAGVTSDNQQAYLKHPLSAVQLLSTLDGVPFDVNKIMMQHHEKMDESGFPYHLDRKKISLLTAIFIISEDISNCLYAGGDDSVFVDDVLDDFEFKYNKGIFKKSLEVLRTALGSQKPKNLKQQNQLLPEVPKTIHSALFKTVK